MTSSSSDVTEVEVLDVDDDVGVDEGGVGGSEDVEDSGASNGSSEEERVTAKLREFVSGKSLQINESFSQCIHTIKFENCLRRFC